MSLWGFKNTDMRGKHVEEVLKNDNLILPNNNEPTRLNPSNREWPAIDLTITISNAGLAQRLIWQV